MKIVRSITTNAATETIWSWLTDFKKLKQWNQDMKEQRIISEGDPRPGFISEVAIKEGRKVNWYRNEILEYQPNKHLEIQLRGENLGKNPMTVRYDLHANGSQTKLTYTSLWSPHGFFLHLLYPIIIVVARANVKNCLKRLEQGLKENM